VIRVMKSELVAILLFFHFVKSASRLGHIGDQVFGLALTNLIQDRYPHLRVGPASVRRYSVIHPLVLSNVGNIQKVRDYVKHKPVLAEM
jgi:dsRNA-specific ribonuclease